MGIFGKITYRATSTTYYIYIIHQINDKKLVQNSLVLVKYYPFIIQTLNCPHVKKHTTPTLREYSVFLLISLIFFV